MCVHTSEKRIIFAQTYISAVITINVLFSK